MLPRRRGGNVLEILFRDVMFPADVLAFGRFDPKDTHPTVNRGSISINVALRLEESRNPFFVRNPLDRVALSGTNIFHREIVEHISMLEKFRLDARVYGTYFYVVSRDEVSLY